MAAAAAAIWTEPLRAQFVWQKGDWHSDEFDKVVHSKRQVKVALHTDTIPRPGDPKSGLSAGVARGALNRKWRFHDEVQHAIRPDQQRKILIVVHACPGHIEDAPGVFEQGVHVKHLSAGIRFFSEMAKKTHPQISQMHTDGSHKMEDWVRFLRKTRTVEARESSK